MTPLYWIVGLVAAQRLSELVYARRNTARLLAAGAVELGAGHYPLFIALHTAWIAALLLLIPGDRAPNWWLVGVYGVLSLARVWVLATLGPYWTTRIIMVPNAPLVRRGPYRFVSHPNYLVVAAELLVLPWAFGEPLMGLAFLILNAPLTAHRIRVENTGLAPRRGLA